MAELPTDPKIAAWVCLMRASAALLASIRAELRTAGFPPLDWYDVLWELERAPERALRPVELECRLLLAQYNVSRLIDRLARAGYLTKNRCDVDGRGQVLTLTKEGKALRERMWCVYSAALERHVGSHLTDDEARSLCRLLVRLQERDGVKPTEGAS
jgi:DNA-binding MarR family transcriptional regulator